MQVGRRAALAALSLCALILLAPLGWLRALGVEWCWIAVLALMLSMTALVFGYLYFRLSLTVRLHTDLGDRTTEISKADESLSKLSDKLAGSITAEEAARFATMIVEPWHYFERISERVEPLTRALDTSTTFSFALELSGRRPAMIPLLQTTRGGLTNGLRFTDAHGTRLSSVPQLRATAYILAVLRMLVRAGGTDALDAYRAEVEPDVTAFLLAEQRPPKSEVVRVTRTIKKKLGGQAPRGMLAAVAKVVRRLADDHPICLELRVPDAPSDDTARFHQFRITARQRLHPDYAFRAKTGEPRSRLDALRVAFGIRQGLINVPIANASRTTSYHLEVLGPQGTYLARQDIVDDADVPRKLSTRFRAAPRRGQRHAHLHMRRNDGARDLTFRAQFYERMPGSMAVATAGALSVAVMCGLGLLVTASPKLNGLIGSWEYGAIILAFPVAASLWIGVDGDRQLNQGVLLSRASTLISIALACMGASLNVLAVRDPAWWYALVILATANALMALCSWVARARLEARFISRVGPVHGQ